jgi:multidrug efflux pump subunit AcrA (membrane-fusion protein)
MEVEIELVLTLPEGRPTLPREAVRLPVEGGPRAEVVLAGDAGGPARPVKLGFLGDDRVEILSGLKGGDEVLLPAARRPAP